MPYAESIVRRFWAKVSRCAHGEDCIYCCWPWQGARDPDGYGNFYVTKTAGKVRFAHAHVMAWELHQQRFLSLALCGLHHCDNTPCCNYHHIFAGTRQDNVDDMHRKGREARGAAHGSRTKPASFHREGTTLYAQLTAPQVLELRALAATGEYTCIELARRYNASHKATHNAVTGITWAHLPGAVRPRWRRVLHPRGADGRLLPLSHRHEGQWCKGQGGRS